MQLLKKPEGEIELIFTLPHAWVDLRLDASQDFTEMILWDWHFKVKHCFGRRQSCLGTYGGCGTSMDKDTRPQSRKAPVDSGIWKSSDKTLIKHNILFTLHTYLVVCFESGLSKCNAVSELKDKSEAFRSSRIHGTNSTMESFRASHARDQTSPHFSSLEQIIYTLTWH